MLQGKGVIIWQIERTDGGNAQRIAQAAVSAGLLHIVVKVADGATTFPADAQAEAMTTAAIAALKTSGIDVWGWQFVYGRNPRNPSERIALAEADTAIQRVQSFGLSGFMIDFENSGHPIFTYRGDNDDARQYMERLRQSIPGVTLAAASHRFPGVHPNLPWDAFMSRCDVAMPQMYWVQGEPEPNLDESLRQYRSRWPFLIYLPIGSAYGEANWSATPDQVTRFMQRARTLDLPAVTFWSWQAARNTPLWDAIARFDWTGPLEPHPSEHTVWVIAPAGLRFRSQPALDDGSWIDRVVFPHGTSLIAIGNPTPAGAGSYRWQQVRAPDGRNGWVAFGIGDERYLGEQPPVDTVERPVWVTASSGIRFRQQPSTSSEWIDRIVFMPGTRLTAIGPPTSPDNQGCQWQRVRTAEGRTGWIARARGNESYVQE